jgi:hypothetical protein
VCVCVYRVVFPNTPQRCCVTYHQAYHDTNTSHSLSYFESRMCNKSHLTRWPAKKNGIHTADKTIPCIDVSEMSINVFMWCILSQLITVHNFACFTKICFTNTLRYTHISFKWSVLLNCSKKLLFPLLAYYTHSSYISVIIDLISLKYINRTITCEVPLQIIFSSPIITSFKVLYS